MGQCQINVILQLTGCLRVPVFFNERQVSDINNRRVAPNNVNTDMFNEKIPFREVLVIDADGNQLGVMPRREALEIAYRQNLDLLCVAPKARPAVCKVLDYGRYHFEQQKKAKESKRKQHTVELKALRLSPVVDTHDFETKVKQAKKWLPILLLNLNPHFPKTSNGRQAVCPLKEIRNLRRSQSNGAKHNGTVGN